MSATTTLIGNTTADIELRYSQAGKPVGTVTIAVSDRKKNAQTGEWEDGKTWFARGTIFGPMAEHAAGTLFKGTRVIASGRIEQDSWNDKDGNPRTSVGVIIDEIGPSLRYATATVTRAAGGSGNAGVPRAAESADSWNTPGEDSSPF
jgi:single-strand DNA-binding protein